jgi:hypothetical protein
MFNIGIQDHLQPTTEILQTTAGLSSMMLITLSKFLVAALQLCVDCFCKLQPFLIGLLNSETTNRVLFVMHLGYHMQLKLEYQE